MYFLALFSVIAILLTFFEGRGKIRNGMLIGFIIIVLISAIRYDYGNDYWSYYDKFQNISLYKSLSDIISNYNGTELLWVLLNFAFRPLGFNWFLAVLSIINGIVYYKLIKNYVDVDKRWFAVFVYLFSNAFFSVQLSMLRQSLAMGLLILAYMNLENKRYISTTLLAISAVLIHTSAIFAIPLLLMPFFSFKKNKIALLILCGFSIAFFVFGNEVLNASLLLLDSSEMFERYQDKYVLGSQYETSGLKNILGLVLLMYPVIMHLLYIGDEKNDVRIKRLCFLSVIGIVISFMSQSIPMAGRLSWYYTIFSVVAVPQAFFNVKSPLIRNAVIVLFMLVTIKEYVGFYTSDTWSQMHYHYHTLFELW